MPLHHEEIKAKLRMRYGSLLKFEAAQGLRPKSVNDLFQGKTIRATAQAIADDLGVSLHWLFPGRFKILSSKADVSARRATTHSLNAEGK